MSTALPWVEGSDVPTGRPVLVKLYGEVTPVMVVRHSDYEPDCVDHLLGPDPRGYGVFTCLTQVERWLDVLPT